MTVRVPYLSEYDIECAAELLLAQANQAPDGYKIPIENIVEKFLKLRVEFDDLHQVLGVPKSGVRPDIFGAIWVTRREIFIDQSLDPEDNLLVEGRYRFTWGHEAAHWWMHRPYLSNYGSQGSLLGESQRPTAVCRSGQLKEPIEWQADVFASCVLMPRSSVLAAWRGVFGSRKIAWEAVKHLPEVPTSARAASDRSSAS